MHDVTQLREFSRMEKLLAIVLLSATPALGRSDCLEGSATPSVLPKLDRSVAIYQLPVRTYFAEGRGRAMTGHLTQLTEERLEQIKDLGIDYLWLTGVVSHADPQTTDPDVVKGEAGSFYAITDHWDVSAQVGDLASFKNAVKRAHDKGLRILIDLVVNHTARLHTTRVDCKKGFDFGGDDNPEYFFLPSNNYFYLKLATTPFRPPAGTLSHGQDGYFDTDLFTEGIQEEWPAKATGNNVLAARPSLDDWFETAKLNYGYNFVDGTKHFQPTPKTWLQMMDVARHWLDLGVDGFRIDFAHTVPLEFFEFFSTELRQDYPNLFLLAEAYENDSAMRVPGFRYEMIFDAGVDSVYNSSLYWRSLQAARAPRTSSEVRWSQTPAAREDIAGQNRVLTNYMENHDEIRLASSGFLPGGLDRSVLAQIGLAWFSYITLMPGHVLIHGGQEVAEDAAVFGSYARQNFRTSIFDFVYQDKVLSWLKGEVSPWVETLRGRYQRLLKLKQERVFSSFPREDGHEFIEFWSDQDSVLGFARTVDQERYLIVLHADSFVSRSLTIRLGQGNSFDAKRRLLQALAIDDSDQRYVFEDQLMNPGWSPRDPAVQGIGIPGSALHRNSGVPSGLHLGRVDPGTIFVFRVTPVR